MVENNPIEQPQTQERAAEPNKPSSDTENQKLQNNELGDIIPQPLQCKYCKKTWKNKQALRSHLRGCPDRILTRYFTVGGYVFELKMNPKKKIVKSLSGLLKKMEQHPSFFKDPKAGFVAAVWLLHEAEIINSYKIYKDEQKPGITSSK